MPSARGPRCSTKDGSPAIPGPSNGPSFPWRCLAEINSEEERPSAVHPKNPRTKAKLREKEREEMIWTVVLGLFLLCAGMNLVFSLYLLMLWCAGLCAEETEAAAAVKGTERGLTEEELEKLEEGKVGPGGGLECAVCLEEIVEGQVARVLPACRHAFHRPCADSWLQAHPSCPLCRACLLPTPSQPQPQVTSSPPA